MDDEPDRLPFLHARLPSSFERRVIVIAPGRARLYDGGEWRDAIVVVVRGEVELRCRRGARRSFGRGDVLWLDGLPLRSLHNPGQESAVLVAISRRTTTDLP